MAKSSRVLFMDYFGFNHVGSGFGIFTHDGISIVDYNPVNTLIMIRQGSFFLGLVLLVINQLLRMFFSGFHERSIGPVMNIVFIILVSIILISWLIEKILRWTIVGKMVDAFQTSLSEGGMKYNYLQAKRKKYTWKEIVSVGMEHLPEKNLYRIGFITQKGDFIRIQVKDGRYYRDKKSSGEIWEDLILKIEDFAPGKLRRA